MNREELKGILPHREPMLLVDEAELEEENLILKKAIAIFTPHSGSD